MSRFISPQSNFFGPEEDRTPDLLLAKQALSQLSYRPEKKTGPKWIRTIDPSVISTVL